MRLLALLPVVALGLVLSLCAPPSAKADALYDIRMCESGGDYAINTGNGYYGAYQFDLDTWYGVGGTGYPHLASAEEQDARAMYLLTRFGPERWPVCQWRIQWQ